MNKNKKVTGMLFIVLVLSLGITAETFVLDDAKVLKGDGKVTVVSTPKQEKAETPSWYKKVSVEPEDLGTNLAAGKTVQANGYQDVYEAKGATDGDVTTYWEGKARTYPNQITVDLGIVKKIAKVRLRLNPDVIWGKRTQVLSILGSTDGKNFKELIASANYDFDPNTGNFTVATLPAPSDQRYVRLEFTQNTGAYGGQVAEFEVFSAK